MDGYIVLLIVVGIVSFFGGFGCGVESEHLRNQENLKNEKNKN